MSRQGGGQRFTLAGFHFRNLALMKNDSADQLNIKANTVRTHIRAIFETLGVSRQTEAVARALRDHLI